MPRAYFEYTEGVLKQFNPTVSVTNKHKYIASQFQDPKQEALEGLLKSLCNFMHLGRVYPKEYEELFDNKLNCRVFLDLLRVMLDKKEQYLQVSYSQQYVLHVFDLFRKCKGKKEGFTPEEIPKYYEVFSRANVFMKNEAKCS